MKRHLCRSVSSFTGIYTLENWKKKEEFFWTGGWLQLRLLYGRVLNLQHFTLNKPNLTQPIERTANIFMKITSANFILGLTVDAHQELSELSLWVRRKRVFTYTQLAKKFKPLLSFGTENSLQGPITNRLSKMSKILIFVVLIYTGEKK